MPQPERAPAGGRRGVGSYLDERVDTFLQGHCDLGEIVAYDKCPHLFSDRTGICI
jgi:hypothetical protein